MVFFLERRCFKYWNICVPEIDKSIADQVYFQSMKEARLYATDTENSQC